MRIHDWEKEDWHKYRAEICKKSQRKRRAAAQKMGLCIICCKRPARDGMKTCAECSRRSAEWFVKNKNVKN